MTSTNNIQGKVGYKDVKTCARLGCPDAGIHRLKVIHIGRTGLFCDIHRIELLRGGIVEPVVEEGAVV